MSFHWCDNLHTAVFSPRDYQVELLAAAFERNTMICLGHKSSKEFIALKLLQELGRVERSKALGTGISIYLSNDGAPAMYTMLQNMTDLKVVQEDAECEDKFPPGYQVYIMRPLSCLSALRSGALKLEQVLLLVLEDCHQGRLFNEILPIFREFYDTSALSKMPRILGMAGPLHSAGCALAELSAMLNTLERTIHCSTETASDVVTVLRFCSKPYEYIVQCAPYTPDELTNILQDIILTRRSFLIDHRYDPFEIYNSEEFFEELRDIPDPKKEPIEFLDTILIVLQEMGPWTADRVAINLYHRIEKQKIKTPHERHYILLCLVNTALLEIHAICEQHFRKFSNHKQLVQHYSSPKALRLLEILRLFKPEEIVSENGAMRKMSQELDQMDFQKLTRSLESSCHNAEYVIRKQPESRSIIENLDAIIKPTTDTGSTAADGICSDSLAPLTTPLKNITDPKTEQSLVTNVNKSFTNRRYQGFIHPGRTKRRVFTRRQVRDQNDIADTLCAIIYCNSNYTARVLFDLLSEMSRHDGDLKFLKCQFTTDRVADPLVEPKEAEMEHRRQEEVLKRFRMHDCNVLIGTSVLEEGIDVPKCNLVIRWDPPVTYRSYVQCKGRARAVPAYHVILVAPKFDIQSAIVAHNNREQLSATSHRLICNTDLEKNLSHPDSDSSSHDDESSDVMSKQKFTIGSSKGTVKILNPEVITNKPPTASELILKEIKDNTPAIEDVKEKDTVVYKNESNVNDDFDKSLKSADDCFEVFDLNEEPVAQIELESSKLETRPISPDRTEAKGRFQCLLQTEPGSESGRGDDANSEKSLDNMKHTTIGIVKQMAEYREIEKMLLEKCANIEPADSEHQEADAYTNCVSSYKPLAHLLTSAAVDLSTSIALINKYCAKLPSDTFTKLTPLWRCARTERNGISMYQYTLRLPINSPLKYDIVGLPMRTHVLARRLAALQACVELHKCGELDDNLQPIGKEGFRAIEPDWENFELEEQDERIVQENSEPRPGTTKRRQYYYKRIASEFCDCRPVAGKPCFLYLLDLTLQCPIPEEQNTRGRKIYPPEDAQQSFGILTLKKIPKVSSFPIFTRSGEVKVALVLHRERIVLTETQINCINIFINYTFTKVLRLKKFLMLFDPESTENCVFIVPTVKTDDGGKMIDWPFLELIERNANMMPTAIPEEVRHATEFDANKFKDAVVMPWYRNQDQPHYFYVAEICHQLSPLSLFPSSKYLTFMHYYYHKYGLKIHTKQPLLDVDHTSARLNFLTPRYVNRKGVALPTSSEETKRAKRENLELKQILVPELCTVHPFPASLWRTAVCLPCILYRINGLLLADDIRKKVVADIGLGQPEIGDDCEWPMLDFGWSLSDVLKKSKTDRKQPNGQQVSAQSQLNELDTPRVVDDDVRVSADELLKKSQTAEDVDVDERHADKSANEIVRDGERKLIEEGGNSDFIEIGTWSNDMVNELEFKTTSSETEEEEYEDELMEGVLPPNVKLCGKKVRAASPTFIDIKLDDELWCNNNTNGNTDKQKRKETCAYYDSDDSFASSYEEEMVDGDTDDDDDNTSIAFTSKNEAETIETAQEIEKRNKQLSIIQATNANERDYQQTKNLQVGYNFENVKDEMTAELRSSIATFENSTKRLEQEIENSGMLVPYNAAMMLPIKKPTSLLGTRLKVATIEDFTKLLPYVGIDELVFHLDKQTQQQALTLETLHALNLNWVRSHPEEHYSVVGCGDIFDNFNDSHSLQLTAAGEKQLKIDFEQSQTSKHNEESYPPASCNNTSPSETTSKFSFDYQPDLSRHPGPSPSIILQALTMSNANDGINLERLETIGDSFLKYAITTYLYITYENVHEGKLSHLRSKQVANLNLYRLGRRKQLGEYMIATKFEPNDNWLPPCYYVPKELEKALIEAKIPPHYWSLVDLANIKKLSNAEICELVRKKADEWGVNFTDVNESGNTSGDCGELDWEDPNAIPLEFSCFIPYNLVSQHSIPDKSVADCVEALIGAYLIECGLRGALLFMAWLGIRVLPYIRVPYDAQKARLPGSTLPDAQGMVTVYGEWTPPRSPLLHYAPNAEQSLDTLLTGYDEFEAMLGYRFRDRSYLLQAMTHASYTPNRLTDCYQRLEFLGDAVLDYLITRHLYEDPRQHSPGALTDLRSALVNNTIFASLAVRHGFHKYFRHLSPGLNEVIDRFVRIQTENGHSISEEYYLLSEEECDDAEDVEVPKALGDVFESIAGAIFLDSNMSLDEVWRVYSNMMRPEIEQFSNSVPKSPIRELLELEPETAKFGKPEKLADGRRVRVTVEVFCKGTYRGIGRNYRIAKCTAAKCALRHLKKKGLITKKDESH